MAVTTYTNPASPSIFLSAADFEKGYRQDFVAAHSDWRKPENIQLKMGMAGGERISGPVDTLDSLPSSISFVINTGAFVSNTLYQATRTELQARSSDILASIGFSIGGCEGLLVAIKMVAYVTSGTPASQFVWDMVFRNPVDESTIKTDSFSLLQSDGTIYRGVAVLNDGTWDAVRMDVEFVSEALAAAPDTISIEFDLFLANSGVINEVDYNALLPSISPIIQTDSEVILSEAGTTKIDLDSKLNTGSEQLGWAYTPADVGIMNGGDTYQLIVPNPLVPLDILSIWKSIVNGEGLNLCPLCEQSITSNDTNFDTFAVADDSESVSYPASYQDAVGSDYRMRMGTNIGSAPNYAQFATTVYSRFTYRDTGESYYLLPAGTYGISVRVRVPGYAVGEVTYVAQHIGFSVQDRLGGLITNQFYQPAEGDVFTSTILTDTFVVPADGIVLVHFDMSLDNTGAATEDKLPVYDNLMIWDNSKTSPVLYNSGVEHPLAFVLEVDETDTADNYEYDSGWVLSGNQSPFVLIESSDATFPAPVTPTDTFDGIDWPCDCSIQSVIMNQLLTAAQPIVDDYDNLVVKTLQIQSDSRPSDALIITQGAVEGIDVLNDTNVQILWVDSSFNYVGKFIVYNDNIILMSELPGDFGYTELYYFEISADRTEAVLTIQTYGDNFAPMVHINGEAEANVAVWVRETNPDSITSLIYDLMITDRYLANGIYDITIDSTPSINSADVVGVGLKDRELKTYIYTVNIYPLTTVDTLPPGRSGEDGSGIMKSVIMELLYF